MKHSYLLLIKRKLQDLKKDYETYAKGENEVYLREKVAKMKNL